MSSLEHFVRDPRYGDGVYRRLVRLVLSRGQVLAKIDDTHHAMWLLLEHDAEVIVSVEAMLERAPATSCGGAPQNLSALAGLPLGATQRDISARLPPMLNCTHLGDLARWAMRAARSPHFGDIQYRISVPDSRGEPVWLEIERNGDIVHRWLVGGNVILAPEEIAGRPLLRGFLSWARDTFEDDDEFEAAVMLQRGAWVARGRPYIVDRSLTPLRAAAGMKDACFSYSGGNWATATNNLGYVRDFTDGIVEHPLPGRIAALFQEDHHGAN